MDEKNPKLEIVTLQVCELCLDGKGGVCHVPGCAFCRATAPDISIRCSILPRPTPPDEVGVVRVYISSSWKNREAVRRCANGLRAAGFIPYDFTDPRCRKSPEIPPERFPENFDPEKHEYSEYIQSVPEWRGAVEGNKAALDSCDAVVLMLPCGNDAHADAFYALGRGKRLVVCGQPAVGDRTPTHMWAEAILPTPADAIEYLLRRRSAAEAAAREYVERRDE